MVVLRQAPENLPRRHCSPDGVLCLLGRDTSQWIPSITLRALLDEKLEDALNGTGTEDPQGEPEEFWWNCLSLPDSYCLVDSGWSVGPHASGTLRLRLDAAWKGQVPVVRAAVTEIVDAHGHPIVGSKVLLPLALRDTSIKAKMVDVPWIRLNQAPLPSKPSLGAQLDQLARQAAPRPRPVLITSKNAISLFAVLYETELGFGERGLGYLFVAAYGALRQFRKKNNAGSPRWCIIRTLRAGYDDLGIRVPAVQRLRGKRIAVFGLGALGAPIAMELARNGCGTLYLVDHDVVEPGNSVRWVRGASAWGISKASALAELINQEYPWTSAEPRNHFIGQFADPDRINGDAVLFDEVLANVDIAIDAAASHGVTGILSDYCRRYGIPLVTAFATPNLEGGLVASFTSCGGCPTCLETAWASTSIAKPRGLDVEDNMRQPPGCAERTFTGASYDLQEISLQAVRVAIDALDGVDDSVAFTLTLADDGGRIAPSWERSIVVRSPGCTCKSLL